LNKKNAGKEEMDNEIKLSSMVLMRKYKLGREEAMKICNEIRLNRWKEARILAKEVYENIN
jgi:hypothetical protein